MFYTLVRHSAYEHNRDNQFRYAVEEFAMKNSTIERVKAAGGLVFDNYKEAYDAALVYNYPPGNDGLIPAARGTFKNVHQVRSLFIPETPLEKL